VKYTVINRETSPMNAVFGLEVIPELEGAYAGTDTVTYNSQTQIFSDRKTEALGFKLLSGNVNSLNAFMYYSNYNTDANFWNWLTNGTIITQVVIDPTTPNVDDPVIIPSFNSKTIAVGDSAIYYVGIGYGLNKSKMLYNMQLVQQNYNILNPTPVELTSFNGLFSNNTVKLSWETATETNNRGFDIERCEGNNWSTLSFITGKGTTIEPSKYFYSDVPDKSGTYKYRLKQIDFDGKVNYSKEITVEFNRNINSYALSQNYPNPFNPTTSFSYQIPVAGFVSLKVFDVLGKEVATLVNENKVQGSYEVNFDAKKLTSGVYIYQLRINNNIISKKMNLLK
jgi:hypothetical protein